MTPFLVALSFLTVFPATWNKTLTQQQISRSRAYYPLVGLLIGILLVIVELGAGLVFNPLLTGAVLLTALVVCTRGLHLDGFMDICDGLFGGYTADRRLEIMRDSHVGAFAVVGVVSLMLLKYGALVSLVALPTPGKWLALLLFPMLSRWGMVVALGGFSYVRSQGLGSPFHQGKARLSTAVAAFIAVAASVILGGIGGVIMLFGASALALSLGWVMSRMLGGLTGDIYGATNEIIEVAALMAAVALLPTGLIEPLPRLIGGL